MCGVIGFYTEQTTEDNLSLLFNLTRESKVRGLHAFGWAWCDKSTLQQERTFNVPEKECFSGFEGKEDFKLIFHNRYSTSGDWREMKNNQPIVVGNRAIAMNGIITMKPVEEWEREFGVDCETENDAEIFLRLLEQRKKPLDVLKNIMGSFAGVLLEDKVLWVLRNEKRPLYYFKEFNATYVVSTLDIINRACSDKVKIYVVPVLQMLLF